MRGVPDPDLLLIEEMLAPPPLEDARGSLEYWRSRRRSLPIYRRSARREADVMVARWQNRVRAAEQRRYRSRLIRSLHVLLAPTRLWLSEPRFGAGVVARFAWRLLPRRLKVAVAALVMVALVVLAGAVAAIVIVLGQLA